jgi:RNA polymerase sigma-70 factor (ECF subfamily)
MPPDTEQDSTAPNPRDFVTTHWSMVLSAAGLNSERAEEALAELCRIYRPPLFAFIQARGYSHHDAEDLVQEFFSRLLKKNYLAAADQSRGRFRSFLLASLKHFLANEWDKTQTLKRGGGKVMVPIDLKAGETSCGFEPAGGLTADRIFDQRWATTLLDQVVAQLAKEYAEIGHSDLYESLRGVLTKEEDSLPYSEIAARRGMTEAAVKMAVQRMRSRYRALLREEIAKTVPSPDEVEDEIRHLFLTF